MNSESEKKGDKPTFRDRVGAAGWWFFFVGFPVAMITMLATIVVDLSDLESRRLSTATAAISAVIGFLYGRRLPGLPWAE